MRVLVCGSREYNNVAKICTELHNLLMENGNLVVIEGGARGADGVAADWAKHHRLDHVQHISFPAQWNKYGKSAGMIRNRQMLEEGKPDLVLAFYSGPEKSKGTANMVSQSSKAEVRVAEYFG